MGYDIDHYQKSLCNFIIFFGKLLLSTYAATIIGPDRYKFCVFSKFFGV